MEKRKQNSIEKGLLNLILKAAVVSVWGEECGMKPALGVAVERQEQVG